MINQVSLRPVAEADLPLSHRLFTDPADTGEHEWHGWQDTDGCDGYVGWHRRATGGQSSFWEIEIGLAPEARGHGHGTDAQRQLARYLFAHIQVNRVEAETEITNIAEQRALEKAGFTREGVRRGAMFRDGQWRDAVMYGVPRHEVDLQ